MKPLFLQYPKCGTCVKAAKFLKEKNIEVDKRDITIDNPSVEELSKWIPMSGLPIRTFFNTSGVRYTELGLKDRIKEMSDAEMIDLLATDGKLVKRPLLIVGDRVLVGFKPEEWDALI